MTEARFDPPFRAEHIGSFLRPAALLAARQAHADGTIEAAALRAAEDAAIRDVVNMQESLGLKVVTDGEYRRGTYSDNFTTSGLVGVRAEWIGTGDWAYTDADGHRTPARIPVVHDRIRWDNSANAADFAYLHSVARAVPKITLPGPCYIHYRAGRRHISRDAYPDLHVFWTDLIAAYQTELRMLAAAGCRYVQLDETSLAKLGDPKIQNALAARGDDWRALLDLYVQVTNTILAGVPAGMQVGMHLCRGNNQGHWQAAGGYDAIAEKLFRELDIRFFFLEYDSDRAGGFTPLAQVPDDKIIVLGLVSTKVAEVEAEEFLIGRIHEAARHISLDQLALSPQCGFASTHKGNALSIDQEMGKIRRIVEIADKIWH